ncbi:MAG TPA: hypothetical protein VGR81_06370 [Candidatus Acidoferrales bacterium]|nr:hypothetical protein [Candidatus Acidoferrales bacterium]
MKPGILATLFLALAIPASGQEKKRIVLDVAGQAAAWADMVTTAHVLDNGNREADPVARTFTALPRPAYFAVGSAMAFSLDIVGQKMRHSRHKWERKIWWLPQVAQIAANGILAAHNASLQGQPEQQTVIITAEMRTKGAKR